MKLSKECLEQMSLVCTAWPVVLSCALQAYHWWRPCAGPEYRQRLVPVRQQWGRGQRRGPDFIQL